MAFPRDRAIASQLSVIATSIIIRDQRLDKRQYKRLKKRLQQWVKLDEDSVRFYPLSGHTLSQVEIWGGVPLSQPPESTII